MMRSCIVAFVCVAFSGAHAKIIHTESFGGQHPDAHIHGFTLRAIYTHRTSQGDDGAVHNHLHKRILKFDTNPHLLSLDSLNARRKLLQASLPAFTATLNNKERVLALAKLNLLAYPGARNGNFPSYYYSQEVVDPIYANGDGIFGTSNTRDGELDYMKAMWDAVKVETNAAATSAGNSWKYVAVPNATAETTIGVFALQFTRGKQVCVVFRGSTTDGDFANIQGWLYDWILERMSSQMKKMWVEDAGLVWGDDQKKWENEGDKIATAAIRTSSTFFPSKFPQLLYDAVTAANISDFAFSQDDAKKYGYWPISRYIADNLHKEVTASGEELLLSGHSQGGTRASLVSMYLRKKHGVTYNAVTFAATGAQCFPRKLGSGADLLADVDPYISHPQITEYSHVLDPWGQAIGLDVGKVCLYGKKDILTTKAYKYCSKVFGHPGPNLIYANSDAVDVIKTDFDRQLAINFRECRLFTHLIETMLQDISAPGVLLDNGDTADGCKLMEIASKDDPNKSCPTGSSWYFWFTAGGIVVAIIIILTGLVLIACCCCRQWRAKKAQAPAAA